MGVMTYPFRSLCPWRPHLRVVRCQILKQHICYRIAHSEFSYAWYVCSRRKCNKFVPYKLYIWSNFCHGDWQNLLTYVQLLNGCHDTPICTSLWRHQSCCCIVMSCFENNVVRGFKFFITIDGCITHDLWCLSMRKLNSQLSYYLWHKRKNSRKFHGWHIKNARCKL